METVLVTVGIAAVSAAASYAGAIAGVKKDVGWLKDWLNKLERRIGIVEGRLIDK